MTHPAHSDGIAGFRRARVRVSDHVTDPIPVPNASERLRAQDEIEIELRVVEAVFLVQLGTAAVGPDAGLHVIHAHHRRIRRLQLAVVSLGGQLLLLGGKLLLQQAIGLVTGQLVSYIKARAEASGLNADGGFIERPERLIIVLVGAGLSGLPVFPLPWALPVAMWLLAVPCITLAPAWSGAVLPPMRTLWPPSRSLCTTTKSTPCNR